MISRDKDDKLIRIYCFVCDKFEDELQFYCQRFTCINKPAFSAQEIMTINLYAMHHEGRRKVTMPIINCSGKRSGKVAVEITDKGFCSTISS